MRQIFSKQIDIAFQKTVFVTVASGTTSMGRHLSAFFCTEPGRSKPFRDVSTYLPNSTCIASQKSLALALTRLRASVFIYYLSVWRQMYTLFRSEDGGSRFLRNVRNPTALHGVTSHRTVT